ncbi:zinc-binding dehydrogenase [Mycolicibacterium vaccae]|uniref:zinc-binding dehydrogenase n=1 Tax=Mycolicibacterium vaccae TaxID=1810 RepID=UPI003CF7DFBA
MKAVSCSQGALQVVDLPDPRPTEGQLVLDVLRCGICGSDLHAKDHADELTEVMAEGGYHDFMRGDTPTVMGHEFCGVIRERGRKVGKKFTEGTTVVAFPIRRAGGGVHLIGLSPLTPGAYAEQVVTEAALTFAVPNGLDPATAALTEPMSVALHAVRRSEVATNDVAIVIGCGPVGLGIICQLKARGVRTIVASDFSPARRALAARCGAHVVVDPAVESPYEAVPPKQRGLTDLPKLLELGVGSMEKLRKLPGWSHVYRVADRLGGTAPKRPVIFECVGIPGMIDGIIAAAPLASRIMVVGVCMGRDVLRPAMAIGKEVELRFVFGQTPLEYRDALYQLAEGKVDASPLVSATVGLDGVSAAFDALRDPETHAKVLIDPASDATLV